MDYYNSDAAKWWRRSPSQTQRGLTECRCFQHLGARGDAGSALGTRIVAVAIHQQAGESYGKGHGKVGRERRPGVDGFQLNCPSAGKISSLHHTTMLCTVPRTLLDFVGVQGTWHSRMQSWRHSLRPMGHGRLVAPIPCLSPSHTVDHACGRVPPAFLAQIRSQDAATTAGRVRPPPTAVSFLRLKPWAP